MLRLFPVGVLEDVSSAKPPCGTAPAGGVCAGSLFRPAGVTRRPTAPPRLMSKTKTCPKSEMHATFKLGARDGDLAIAPRHGRWQLIADPDCRAQRTFHAESTSGSRRLSQAHDNSAARTRHLLGRAESDDVRSATLLRAASPHTGLPQCRPRIFSWCRPLCEPLSHAL